MLLELPLWMSFFEDSLESGLLLMGDNLPLELLEML
jgi:hypothetical protein